MMLLAAATSLMTIFLGIELLSISLYVLSGFARTALRSQESAMKYLLLGGFASGFLLYGMALIYGATGSTTLRGIAAFTTASGLGASSNVLLLLGIGFLSVGLAFKASEAPFHMWTPDVYEAAPALGAGGERTAELSYWRGLFYRRPFLATVMTIFMLSLAGIPPTVGFFAKLLVFRALVDAQIWAPLIVAVIMTIVSFYYYLRVIVGVVAAPDAAAGR